MCPLNPLGMPLYLVVDTESSVRLNDRCRVLVSLAYEVVDTVGAPSDSGSIIRASGYDIVHQSADLPLDPISLRVHRIDGPTSRSIGRPYAPCSLTSPPSSARTVRQLSWDTTCGGM